MYEVWGNHNEGKEQFLQSKDSPHWQKTQIHGQAISKNIPTLPTLNPPKGLKFEHPKTTRKQSKPDLEPEIWHPWRVYNHEK